MNHRENGNPMAQPSLAAHKIGQPVHPANCGASATPSAAPGWPQDAKGWTPGPIPEDMVKDLETAPVETDVRKAFGRAIQRRLRSRHRMAEMQSSPIHRTERF
jgi:hypothetical protein